MRGKHNVFVMKDVMYQKNNTEHINNKGAIGSQPRLAYIDF